MLNGKTVLLTAGPTWEAIDPVRGITNHSSGKMGYALAGEALELGAKVILVSGPVCLTPPTGVETIQVVSARDMLDAVHQQLRKNKIDLFIGVAAVDDYRPAEVQAQKIKKSGDELTLRLVKNPDIVASVAALGENRPYTVGFAAETEKLEEHARGKLENKRLDMVVANDVSKQGTGFGADQNRVVLISHEQTRSSGQQHKSRIAQFILTHIAEQLSS